MDEVNLWGLRLIYIANIFVAGIVGGLSLFAPATAAQTVFGGAAPASSITRIVGSFWLAITILSVAGLFAPLRMSPVLLVQLLYKGLWLVVVALPVLTKGNAATLPTGMAWFFLVWVLVLPFVIPWRYLLG